MISSLVMLGLRGAGTVLDVAFRMFGVVYAIWRRTGRMNACSVCRTFVVPANIARARRVLGAGAALVLLASMANATNAQNAPRPTLAEQRMCSEQAKKIYNDYLLPEAEQTKKIFNDVGYKETPDYLSHYDPKVGKCFVVFEYSIYTSASTSEAIVFMSVYDAFERTQHAKYSEKTASDGGYGWITSPDGESKEATYTDFFKFKSAVRRLYHVGWAGVE